MELTRRKFVKAGVMVTLFAAIPQRGVLSVLARTVKRPRPSVPDPLNYYTKSTFLPYVNTAFRIYPDALSSKDVTLVEVRDLSAQYGISAPDECFSLLFLGPADTALPQKTYQVEHASLGKFSLFVVPISRHNSEDPEYYEAVFNRHYQPCNGCHVMTLEGPPVSSPARPAAAQRDPLDDLGSRMRLRLRKALKSID